MGITLLALASHAIEPERQQLSIADFPRTTFTEKEGAPEKTWAIAQTNDGWLWFGGSTGLFRFDGVEFEKVDVSTPDGRLSAGVSILYALPSGGLAIGHMAGGVTILDRGQARRFDSELVHAAGRPFDFVADLQGVLWASFNGGLMRLDGNEWSTVGAEWNFPAGTAFALHLDTGGTLWVQGQGVVVRLKAGTRRFEVVATVRDAGMLLQSPAGRFWYFTEAGGTCLCDNDMIGKPSTSNASRKANSYYFDRGGTLWGLPTTIAKRLPFAMTGMDTLGLISQTMEDVEGNIWMADVAGKVHRLRRTAAVRIAVQQESFAELPLRPVSFARANNGDLWMTKWSGRDFSTRYGIWRIENDRLRLWAEGTESLASISSDRAGKLWWIVRRGLWEWDDTRANKRAELPPTIQGEDVGSMAAGCAGGVWLAIRGVGLLRYNGRDWQAGSGIARLPSVAPASLECDAAGRLWMGYGDGRVARMDASGGIAFVDVDVANLGTVSAISVGQHILVGGERGLAVLQHNKLVRVVARLPILQGVTGILQAPGGDIWISGAKGLARLSSADLHDSAKTNDVVPAALFDASDGFPGPASSLAYNTRSLAQDGRGRLWFAGSTGIAHLDPSAIKRGPEPRLVLKSLTADGRRFELFDAPTLEPGTRNLEIAYTALSFAHPDRLRFRYRLDGVDNDWVDVGSRRQAFYTNLEPGKHRFQLDVTDELGIWTGRPETLTFDIPPTFTQSTAFKVLCVAVVLGLLFVAYRLRIGQLERRQNLLMVERLDERGRIARELHDTLLQGTQALVLKVHAASELSRQGQPVHQVLDKALDQATNAIDEARDGIEGLRNRSGPDDDLVASLIRFGDELMKDGTPRFNASVEGSARELVPNILREAFLIAREALLNGFHHADASSIELHVTFAADSLRLQVRDDGRGFDNNALPGATGGRHWGLPGMQERARAISATLAIWSRPGAGTEIELRIPSPIAYAEPVRRWRWRWPWSA